MDVDAVSSEVIGVANAMVRETSLPNFATADLLAHRVRISALDELQGAFDGDVESRRDEKVNVIGHDDEFVKQESLMAAVVVTRLEEKPGISFNDEESAALESRRGHEVCAWGRDQASGFHGRRVIRAIRNWRGWRTIYFCECPGLGMRNAQCRELGIIHLHGPRAYHCKSSVVLWYL